MTDLQEQLAQLREERQRLTDTIQDAGEEVMGDQGDQAESIERINALNALDERIDQMTQLQEDREREPLSPSGDIVAPGTQVTLKYDDGTSETIQVVENILEENDGDPVVTPDSPLGQAVMGATVGQTVSFEAPDGARQAEVVEITIFTG